MATSTSGQREDVRRSRDVHSVAARINGQQDVERRRCGTRSVDKLSHLPLKLLRFAAVRDRTGLSRSTVWRLERRGAFQARQSVREHRGVAEMWPIGFDRSRMKKGFSQSRKLSRAVSEGTRGDAPPDKRPRATPSRRVELAVGFTATEWAREILVNAPFLHCC